MVGIVIVSHSAPLAQGLADLAKETSQGKAPLAAAGGIDDPQNPYGTDPIRILTALEEVYSPDGVLVFMDMGSAVLSAETALDLFDEEKKHAVTLCPGPLVEGVLTAAIQAGAGFSKEDILKEISQVLQAKKQQLYPSEGGHKPHLPQTNQDPEHTLTQEFTVPNALGIHARPAARIVSALGGIRAKTRLQAKGQNINASSVSQLTALSLRQADSFCVVATGPDAQQAIARIQELVEKNFGDNPEQQLHAKATSIPTDEPFAVSPGFALGPAFRIHESSLPAVQKLSGQDHEHEKKRLEKALTKAQEALRVLEKQTAKNEREIFAAQRLLLEDPEILHAVEQILQKERCNAEAAWHEVVNNTAAIYRNATQSYQQERVADVFDVGRRVMLLLSGRKEVPLLQEPAILVAEELGPSDMVQIEPQYILALVTARGSQNSHTAILARSLGIPAFMGAAHFLETVHTGDILGVDGTRGHLYKDPSEETCALLQQERKAWLAERKKALDKAQGKATTRDGQPLAVFANIANIDDAQLALRHGAEGIGLYRTEFLFLERESPPSEDEQTEAYIRAAKAMNGRPLIIRTLDIGGDKPVQYLPPPEKEENPFLGLRGIRFCFAHPELFATQLRALLRAAANHDIRIMFPMIAHPGEVVQAKAALEHARQQLIAAQIPHAANIQTGIMIEVPAAVRLADHLAAQVDFFSIGTNDLTQYVMAADRGNQAMHSLSDALHPAVLRMIHDTVQAGHAQGISVGMCGELAGNAQAIPVLIGLGLDELSMSAGLIPTVKAQISQTSAQQCRKLTRTVLALTSATEVREFLQKEAKKFSPRQAAQ